MEKKLSVIVADDDTLSVRGLLAELKNLPQIDKEKLAQPKNGSEVLDLLKKKKYDVVFLDALMPVMSGLEAAMNIRTILNSPAIIFHTELTDETEIRAILSEDFHVWIEKNCRYDKVITAIEAAMSDKHFLPAHIDEIRKRMLKENSGRKQSDDKTKPSGAEKEVFIDFCNLHDISAIALKRHTSEHTVSGQLKNAKNKLGLDTLRDCIDWAQTNGLSHLIEYERKQKAHNM